MCHVPDARHDPKANWNAFIDDVYACGPSKLPKSIP
jgi:hypothetical protein